MPIRSYVVVLFASLVFPHLSAAQTPPPPPKPWTMAFGAGLSLTSGNTDTSTYNASYDIVFAPNARYTFKSNGLLIRGNTEGEASSDRLNVNLRNEHRVSERIFLFGQNQYLRDRFKEIDYLLAPTIGLGYKAVDTERTKLSLDAGAGGVWEKNAGIGVRASGALTLSQKLTQTISTTTTITQSLQGLWKTEDLDDSLYTFGVMLATAISTRTQIKIEWIDSFNNRPPAAVQKNDVSLLVALVYKR